MKKMNNWDIYEIKNYESILSKLDSRFSRLIKCAKERIDCGEASILSGQKVRKEMEEFMDTIQGYGVSDTEPRTKLMTFICDELNLPTNQESFDKLQDVSTIIKHTQLNLH